MTVEKSMTPEQITNADTAVEAAAQAWDWAMATLDPSSLDGMTDGQKELVLEMVVDQLQAWCDQNPGSQEGVDDKKFGQTVDAGFALWTERKVLMAMSELERMGLISNNDGLVTITEKGRNHDLKKPPAPVPPELAG